jgi:putative oxidoreductase
MELGLLVLRIVVGALFVGHGAQKLFGIFGGHGVSGTAGFFESIGLRPGKLHAVAAGTAELSGGVLLALGLVTPIAALLLTAVMTAAILTVHLRNGVWVTANGYEYNLVLIAVAFALAAVGAGEWSLDNALGLDVAGTGWALGALGLGLLGGLGAAFSSRLRRAEGPSAQPTA